MQKNDSKNYHMKLSNGMLIDPSQLTKPTKPPQVKNWHFHHTIFCSNSNQYNEYESHCEIPFVIKPKTHFIVGDRPVELYNFPQGQHSGTSNTIPNLELIEISDEEGGWNDASQLYKMKISFMLN